MVVLTPPRMKATLERLVSEGHTCGYCHGNGFFWGLDEYGENEKTPCPMCKGSGRLDAVITVEWKAATSPDPPEGGGCLAGTFSEGGGQ